MQKQAKSFLIRWRLQFGSFPFQRWTTLHGGGTGTDQMRELVGWAYFALPFCLATKRCMNLDPSFL
jgi:hypothetical protein